MLALVTDLILTEPRALLRRRGAERVSMICPMLARFEKKSKTRR